MTLLRLFRRDALLAELEIAGGPIELGDRPNDTVRLDELGLSAASGAGGRLEQAGEGWTFTRRNEREALPQPVARGQRVRLGEASFELEPERPGPRLAIPALPAGEPRLSAPIPAGLQSPMTERFHTLAHVLENADEGPEADARLERELHRALSLVGAQHGFVAHVERDSRTLRLMAGHDLPDNEPRTAVARGVLDAVLGQGREMVSDGHVGDASAKAPAPEAGGSFCALPLLTASRVVGLLYVDRGAHREPWSHDDLAFLRLLAVVLARRIEEAERGRVAERSAQVAAGALPEHGRNEEGSLGWVSPAMLRVRQEAERILRAFQSRSLPVLISGESGTGKDVLARWLHQQVERRVRGPFVALNCAAIPHELAESELFGIEKGVATGVIKRLGRFEQAHGGTLFLDEIGAMTLPVQAKLLSTLETRRVRRVGGREEIPVEVRIVAATNASLQDAVRAGVFREDLFWRLAGVELRMPPLRERREDIPVLTAIFADHFAREFGLPVLRLDRAAMARMMAWAWPGNVRELRQRVAALTAASAGALVTVDDLPAEMRSDPEGAPQAAPQGPGEEAVLRPLVEVELAHIRRVLDALGGDRRRAAEVLGMHRKTLARKLAEGEAAHPA